MNPITSGVRKMRREILIVLLSLSLFFLHGCVTPEVVSNNFVYGKSESLSNLHVALMPFLAKELSGSEVEDITQEIFGELFKHANIKQIVQPVENEESLFGGREPQARVKINYYRNNRVVKKLIGGELKSKWESYWNNYLNKKEVNKDVLQELGNVLDVNSVMQFAITDLIRIRPRHREVVAETTVEISYVLFSLNGSVLMKGRSIAKQANAWSGQLTPSPIEVVDIAIKDIFKNFNFYQNY